MEFRIFIQFYLESTMYDEKDTNIPLLRYFPNIVDKTPSCEIYLMNKNKLFYMYKCNKINLNWIRELSHRSSPEFLQPEMINSLKSEGTKFQS